MTEIESKCLHQDITLNPNNESIIKLKYVSKVQIEYEESNVRYDIWAETHNWSKINAN